VALPPAPAFDAVLQGMYERVRIETLPAHLETTHGITVAGLRQLDVGVFRVDRADKAPTLVVRLFSAARPHSAVERDLAVLCHLADGFSGRATLRGAATEHPRRPVGPGHRIRSRSAQSQTPAVSDPHPWAG
jgi:hypothetical protein